MELRICSLLFFAFFVVSQCSVSGHVVQRRSADDEGGILNDEAFDDEAQKDEGNEPEIVGNIETPAQEFIASLGQSVTLPCKVNPTNVPVVNWYKLGVNEEIALYMNTMKFMNKKNSLYNRTQALNKDGFHDLTIDNVELSDAGEYRCQLEQSEKTSIIHTLTIKSGPSITSLRATNNGIIREDAELTLTCEVAGTPPSNIVWMRTVLGETVNARLEEKDAEFTLNTATIKHMKPELAGKYFCYAFNKIGTTQAKIDIVVLGKPRAHVHRNEINTGIGDHALFQCTVRGDPAPSITWFKNNVPVMAEDGHFNISTDGVHSNLTVIPAGDKDFATYTCVAENKHGIHNRSAELVQRPVVEEVMVEGGALSFVVASHLALRRVEVQLMDKDGNISKFQLPIPESQSKTYGFKHEFKDLAQGEYQAFIKAENEKEWSRNLDPVIINIEAEPINIQQSSIYRPNSAHSFSQSATLLCSAFMYLLIRM